MDDDLKVSVIILTRNGERYLRQLFLILQEQSIRPVQILVVDSSSKDNTLKICNTFKVDIISIEAKTFDHGGTRNLAASKATGDILVFMTQDALCKDARCLENLIKPLYDISIAASYGRQIPAEDANPVERFVRSFNYPSAGMIKGMDDLPRLGVKTFFFSNAFSAIKNEAFKEVGRFPERTIMNEDMFLAAKLLQKGYKVAYQPEAVVYHSHNYSLAKQFKRYFDIGVFFSRNRWIKNMIRSEREGMRVLKGEIGYLFANGERKWIPYALVDSSVRLLGYRVGLIEKCLPLSIKRRVSLNKGFWEHDAFSV